MKKVRKIVNLFKGHPTRNDVLQKFVEVEQGKKLHLLRDSKTRWNSTLAMISRFLQLEKSVRIAMIELQMEFDLSPSELAELKKVEAALQPVKCALEALCRRDSNLLKSERIHQFTLGKLDRANTRAAEEIKNALDERVSQRRNESIINLLEYLNNPDFVTEQGITRAKKQEMMKLASELLERLLPSIAEEEEREEGTRQGTGDKRGDAFASSSSAAPPSMTLEEELEEAIGSVEARKKTVSITRYSLVKEFSAYQSTKKLKKILNFCSRL